MGDEAAPQQEFVGAFVELGLMSFGPHQFGQPIVIPEGVSVDAVEELIWQPGVKVFQEFFPTHVKVKNGRSKNPAISGDRNHCLAKR